MSDALDMGCERCDRTVNVIWMADDELWDECRDGYDFLCEFCFSVLAYRQGFLLRYDAAVAVTFDPSRA